MLFRSNVSKSVKFDELIKDDKFEEALSEYNKNMDKETDTDADNDNGTDNGDSTDINEDELLEDINESENTTDDDSIEDKKDKEEGEKVEEKDDDDLIYFKFNTTKHKLEGKHSLKRDTIFHGKLNEEEDNEESYYNDYYNKDFPIENGTIQDLESRNYEEMEIQRRLKKDIYNLLDEKTDLDFSANRRKPNKQAFNNHYSMLLDNLHDRYTKSEIFVELSYYFTDHIFNMYKLLNPEHATNIIKELRDKGFLNELDDMKFV